MDQMRTYSCPSSAYVSNNSTCDIQDSPEVVVHCIHNVEQSSGPNIFLWTAVPFYIFYMMCNRKQPAEVGTVSHMKMYITVFLAILTVVQLSRQKSVCDTLIEEQARSYVDWTQINSFVLVVMMVKLERSREWVTSTPRLLYWLVILVNSCVNVYNSILQDVYTKNMSYLILDMAYLLGLLGHLVLADSRYQVQQHQTTEEPVPTHESASLISQIFMNWVTGFVKKGYTQKLQEQDIPDISKLDKFETIYPVFELAWRQEKEKCNRIQELNRLKERRKGNCKDKSEDGTEFSNNEVPKKDRKPSLLLALFKAYGLRFIIYQAVKCVFQLSQFINPLLLEALMKYITNHKTEPVWKGYALVITMFLVNTGEDTLSMSFELAKQKLLQHSRMSLRIAIFRKALTISNESKRDKTVGEVVSLFSDDVDRVIYSCNTVYYIVVTPIQVCLALYMLYHQLGVGAFVGLAVMLSLIPFNSWVGKKVHTLYEDKTKVKDERVKVMNEILNGMKVLKLYAWEKSFIAKVSEIRKREVALCKRINFFHAFTNIMFRSLPLLVRLSGFLVFIVLGGHLDPAKAFVAASLFSILNAPISFMTGVIPQFSRASVALKRLNDFLTREDISEEIVDRDSHADSAVRIQDGTFTWDKSAAKTTLTNINLKVNKGELVAVVGIIGSGKSSILSAILGEMEKLQGKVTVQSKVAYVSQEAWIQNATVRDNILFGSEYEAERYNQVIKACALKSDLKILIAGDNTEIGEKGVNLSGGQKQRVSLARAVYSNADIFLFDDPLSAVDAHVGKHIFNKVIGHSGMLKNKTRILVTHGVHWLPFVDNIIVMKEGQISECGTYKQLLNHNGAFAQFLKDVFAHEEEDNDSEVQQIKKHIYTRLSSLNAETEDERAALDNDVDEVNCSIDREHDSTSNSDSDNIDDDDGKTIEEINQQRNQKHDSKKGQTVSEEDTEKGNVSLEIYKKYALAVGHSSIVIFTIIYFTTLLSRDFKTLWMGKWTEDPLLANLSLMNTSEYQYTLWMYITVYALSVGVEVLTGFTFSILLQSRTYEAGNLLHNQLLTNVMRQPMSFFDTTPTGRIINRFSKDVESVDELGGCLEGYISCLLSILMNLCLIMYISPKIIVFIIISSVLYMYVQRLYTASANQLRRWCSKHSSPVHEFMKESLSGITTVRAFQAQERFITKLEATIEKHMRFNAMERFVSRWFSIRITFLSQLISLAAGMIVLWDLSISPSMVGLILFNSSSFVHCLAWFVHQSTYTEQELVSLERVLEYTTKPTEASWEIPESSPLAEWPQNGEIDMDAFKIRYREGLDLVLKGVTFNIRSGEKIGIVGRTGAGKSSLTVALFRLVEAASGQIMIDNHQIASMGLHDLRTKITILPQDPMIFGGSLRMNLDPFSEKSTDELWEALKHSHLQTFVESLAGKLDYDCGEGGQNLSGGQRQLVCLARTLLRKTKVLVLDEATAAVDMETDDLIQKTICSEFKDCTVLTIAHRLNTIMDYDRVLVMDHGLVKEFDSPKNLLADPSSLFYSLAKDAKQVS